MELTDSNGQKRTIKFHDVWQGQNWQVKVYSVSKYTKTTDADFITKQMHLVEKWVVDITDATSVEQKIAVLIFHFWETGTFAWLIWWDKNEDTKLEFYFRPAGGKFSEFVIYEDKSMIDFVQEFAILWYERMQWHKYMQNQVSPENTNEYLKSHFA